MALTPLTAGSLLPQSNAMTQLRDRLTLRLYEDFQTQKAEIEENYEQKRAAINATSDRWAAVQVEAKMAIDTIDDNVESANKVRDILLEMRNLLAEIERAPDDLDVYKEQFSQKLAAINNEVTSHPTGYNLIGPAGETDFSPNSIELKTGLGSNVLKMEGYYLGSGFTITEDSGRLWIGEVGSETIRGVATDSESQETASLRNGVTVISYDAATGGITFEIDGTQRTGTLETGGSGILGTWFNDLSSQAVRDSLRSQIDAALDDVELAKGNLANHKAAAELVYARAEREVSDATKATGETHVEQAMEQMEAEAAVRRQHTAMTTNIDAVAEMSSSTQKLLASGISGDNKLLGFIVDENV